MASAQRDFWGLSVLLDFLSRPLFPRLTDNTKPRNEDCGQMSAWFLFSALGFYPGPSHLSSAFLPSDTSDTYPMLLSLLK
jgi:hypothetical protein